jgi:hypothetical protein
VNNSFIAVIIVSAVLFIGCGDKKKDDEAIVRVNNIALYNSDIEIPGDSINVVRLDRNEFIRNWINNELLFQKAVEEGITESDEYLRLSELSNKELAKTLWVDKYLKSKVSDLSEKELEEFYNNNKEIFKTISDSYLINQVIFNIEEKAIQFRNILVESDWSKASKSMESTQNVVAIRNDYFLHEYKFLSGILARIVKEMNAGEISPVIPLENGEFTIVQVIDKFMKDTTPPYTVVASDVKNSYLIRKKTKLLEEYLNQLYNNNEIVFNK